MYHILLNSEEPSLNSAIRRCKTSIIVVVCKILHFMSCYNLIDRCQSSRTGVGDKPELLIRCPFHLTSKSKIIVSCMELTLLKIRVFRKICISSLPFFAIQN